MQKAKDQTALQRAKLLDVAKMSFISDRGKRQAQALWNKAESNASYPDDDPNEHNTKGAASCEFIYKASSSIPIGLSPRDEAKYKLLLPYLPTAPGGSGPASYGLGIGKQEKKYLPKGYRYRLNGLFVEATPTVNPPIPPATPLTYRVTVTADNGGTADGSGTYNRDEEVTVSASHSNPDYIFGGWSVTEDPSSSLNPNNPSNTFKAVAKVTAQAHFILDPSKYYSFNVVAGAGGTASSTYTGNKYPPVGGKYFQGSKFNIKAMADSNHNFANWTGGNSGILGPNVANSTFALGQSDTTLQADFEGKKWVLIKQFKVADNSYDVACNENASQVYISSGTYDESGGSQNYITAYNGLIGNFINSRVITTPITGQIGYDSITKNIIVPAAGLNQWLSLIYINSNSFNVISSTYINDTLYFMAVDPWSHVAYTYCNNNQIIYTFDTSGHVLTTGGLHIADSYDGYQPLTVSSDGKLWTRSYDYGHIKTWDVKNGFKFVKEYSIPSNANRDVGVSLDGKEFYVASPSSGGQIYDTATGTSKMSFTDINGGAKSVAVANGDGTVVFLGTDNFVYIFKYQ